MDMPKPSAEHVALKVFEGTWRGVETMPPSPWAPQTTTADGHIVNRVSLAGFTVVQDYVQSQKGTSTYEGHGVFGWDAQAKQYVLYWFDSMGSPANVFRGKRDGHVWTFLSSHSQGMTRSVWDFATPNAYRHTMEVSPDGKAWSTFMDGAYTKVGG
jgi:hypothetical protein